MTLKHCDCENVTSVPCSPFLLLEDRLLGGSHVVWGEAMWSSDGIQAPPLSSSVTLGEESVTLGEWLGCSGCREMK